MVRPSVFERSSAILAVTGDIMPSTTAGKKKIVSTVQKTRDGKLSEDKGGGDVVNAALSSSVKTQANEAALNSSPMNARGAARSAMRPPIMLPTLMPASTTPMIDVQV
jgi:hypothetical protein